MSSEIQPDAVFDRRDPDGATTPVCTFVGALCAHALATGVLAWTFGGAIESGALKAVVGLVVGAPWLMWPIRLPWAVRDLARALRRRPPVPERRAGPRGVAASVADRPARAALGAGCESEPEPGRRAA